MTTATTMNNDDHFVHLEYPTEWHAKYNDDAKALTGQLIDWLNDHKKTSNYLVRLEGNTKSGRSRMRSLVKGQYPSKQSFHLQNLLTLLSHVDARTHNTETPFIANTTVARQARNACNLARRRKHFSLITGDVGTGKTRSLSEYQKDNAQNTILIESGPNMSPTSMVDDISAHLGIGFNKQERTLEKRFKRICSHLVGTDYLLIIDEAETVSRKMLHYCRRIRDLGKIGVVLAGTPNLDILIKPVGGEFDQIRSRVTFHTGTIRSITKNDAAAVCHAAFPEHEITEEIFATFWSYSKGSMRMLVEHIIPNVIEVGLADTKTPLSTAIIHTVCKSILSLNARTA